MDIIDHQSAKAHHQHDKKSPQFERFFHPTAGYRGFGFEQGEQAWFFNEYGGILKNRDRNSSAKLRKDIRLN